MSESDQHGKVTAVLVVNDDPSICELLRGVLEEEGNYLVETAKDGQQGLALLRQARLPHVLVLDDVMPVLDGYEVLEALAADPMLAQQVACVYLTSRPESFSIRLRQLLNEFNAPVLTLPFEMDVFVHTVEDAALRLRSL